MLLFIKHNNLASLYTTFSTYTQHSRLPRNYIVPAKNAPCVCDRLSVLLRLLLLGSKLVRDVGVLEAFKADTDIKRNSSRVHFSFSVSKNSAYQKELRKILKLFWLCSLFTYVSCSCMFLCVFVFSETHIV